MDITFRGATPFAAAFCGDTKRDAKLEEATGERKEHIERIPDVGVVLDGGVRLRAGLQFGLGN